MRSELVDSTILDYEWQIRAHLLPFFGKMTLSEISVQDVDRYRQSKVREADNRRKAIEAGTPLRDKSGRVLRPLSATSVNKTITRLAQVLESAVEYELIERNVARGKRRKLKGTKFRGTSLDGAEPISALLDAAGKMDNDGRRTASHFRRPLIATLAFAGLRIDEALSLTWEQISLPARTMRVGSKTDAGHRTIDLLPILVDELLALKANTNPEPTALVFGSRTGAKQSYANIRGRVLAVAVEDANATLEAQGLPQLPEPLTPHSLRRTFISILLALGHEVPYVMEQAGHADPKVTLGIYARVMRRTPEDKAQLRALVEGTVWARLGADGAEPASQHHPAQAT